MEVPSTSAVELHQFDTDESASEGLLPGQQRANEFEALFIAAEGDPEAERELFARALRLTSSIVYGKRWADRDNEEIISHCLEKLWQQQSNPDFSSVNIPAWLHRVAVRRAIDQSRHGGRVRLESLEYADGSIRYDAASSAESFTIDETDTVRRFLDEVGAERKIPERFIRALLHKYFGEKQYDEIAELEDIGTGTVRSRIYRGHKDLKEYLATAIGTTTDALTPEMVVAYLAR